MVSRLDVSTGSKSKSRHAGLSTARVFIRQFNPFKVDEISYNWLLLCTKVQTVGYDDSKPNEQQDKNFIF